MIDGNYTTAEKQAYKILERLGADVAEIQSRELPIGALLTIIEDMKRKQSQDCKISGTVRGFGFNAETRKATLQIDIDEKDLSQFRTLARAQCFTKVEIGVTAVFGKAG